MSLARAIRAAVGGRNTRKRLEEDKPEELEDDLQPGEAEDDPENPDAETDDELDPDAEEDDPVANDDEEKSGDYARGRKAERKRMSAILGSAKADQNPSLAAHLAFNTNMSAKQAVATLAASATAHTGSSLSSRMQGRVPALGNGGSVPKAGTADERLIAHAKKRNAATSRHR
ncbi:hypothetical protein [Pseudochrobactrum saccharolyticum]|uniref:hypothetical protein n=1 Tax=Pseudochrobactrum saccharolyticum TaxID=354352 RepID=UPI002775B77F|nr:hypothetical protein [Pseudochrobactrum saccharolyticum]MDP8249614.1 hypothetical protein [Pseudochrobactrum saccharolyticum]